MLDWISNTISSFGYMGIALLMLLENLFPPIPSELIMPLAGFTVTQGKLSFWGVVFAGTLGSIVGALPWYYGGLFFGEERLKQWANRYGKWLTISGKDIDKSQRWFQKYGKAVVFFGRLVPGIRTLISVPAGLEEMPLLPFLVFSTAGSTVWVIFLTYSGYLLGKNYYLVDEYLGPVSKIVLLIILVSFAFWVIQRRKKAKKMKDRK